MVAVVLPSWERTVNSDSGLRTLPGQPYLYRDGTVLRGTKA
jgi:hypothetical protein